MLGITLWPTGSGQHQVALLLALKIPVALGILQVTSMGSARCR
ncbi:hypothetical protein [Nocardioides gansuensis]|nr:hypothetical protein [Nocardioides gansuensis]